MPKIEMIKFKYVLDKTFRIDKKMIIKMRIANIFIDTTNIDFE